MLSTTELYFVITNQSRLYQAYYAWKYWVNKRSSVCGTTIVYVSLKPDFLNTALTNSTTRTEVAVPVLALLSTKYILIDQNFRKDLSPTTI